ncbi:50S ribosomal protein L16 [Candidatus Pacearchaeota archaeon]|nr:50S ribosomal protein L16 [Candidatus Pacearchaeota archaeon]
MVLRKALAYSKKHRTAFTRKSKKVKHLNYIKVVPNQKVTKFNMADVAGFEKGKYKNFITIYTTIHVQIRDLALEAARQFIHNQLGKKLGNDYYFACKPYPHQILRDNKTFSGGSKGERVQSGMSHSFGTSTGRAAYIKMGEPIYVIGYNDKKSTEFIRNLCKSASSKLPCKTKIVYEEVQ